MVAEQCGTGGRELGPPQCAQEHIRRGIARKSRGHNSSSSERLINLTRAAGIWHRRIPPQCGAHVSVMAALDALLAAIHLHYHAAVAAAVVAHLHAEMTAPAVPRPSRGARECR